MILHTLHPSPTKWLGGLGVYAEEGQGAAEVCAMRPLAADLPQKPLSPMGTQIPRQYYTHGSLDVHCPHLMGGERQQN